MKGINYMDKPEAVDVKLKTMSTFCSEIKTMDLLLQVMDQSYLHHSTKTRIVNWFNERMNDDINREKNKSPSIV